MTEEAWNIVGICLFVSSTLVIIAMRIVPGDRSSAGKESKQLQILKRQVSAQSGDALTLDWMRYKAVPRERIIREAAEQGWHHTGDEHAARSWLLTFDRNAHGAAHDAHENDVRRRLVADLKIGEPDATGRLVLDAARYSGISAEEIGRIATSAGWDVVGSEQSGPVLARPGVTTSEISHGPFVDGPSPEELRSDPAVRERARELQAAHGFDPLSSFELNRARERNKHWGTLFYRQVGLAVFYGLVGLFAVGVTFGGSIPPGNPGVNIALAVTVIVFALFGIACFKAIRARKQRNREIGGFLAAYDELTALYRQQHS